MLIGISFACGFKVKSNVLFNHYPRVIAMENFQMFQLKVMEHFFVSAINFCTLLGLFLTGGCVPE